jgi:hypothetical protein
VTWRVEQWDRDGKKWIRSPLSMLAGAAELTVRTVARDGFVAQASNGTEHMRCYPARPGRPLTFAHQKPCAEPAPRSDFRVMLDGIMTEYADAFRELAKH